MVKAGQYKGKQYGIPDDWGFDAILYRSDKVHPKAKSWSLIFDDRYKGRISWFDDLNMLTIAGLYLGFPQPWQPDGRAAQALAEPPDQEEEERPPDLVVRDRTCWEAFGSGDLWIAYAWPNDWVQMKKKKLKVIYMRPEGEADRVGRDVHAASRGRRGRSSRTRTSTPGARSKSGKWLEDNYGYGHANTLARPTSSDLLHGAAADQPEARSTEPNAHLDRDIPRRARLRAGCGSR